MTTCYLFFILKMSVTLLEGRKIPYVPTHAPGAANTWNVKVSDQAFLIVC